MEKGFNLYREARDNNHLCMNLQPLVGWGGEKNDVLALQNFV